MKDHMFRDKPFMRELSRLALPIAAQQLMLAAVSVADTFMLGGVDQNSMSAVSLAGKIQFLQNMIVSCAVSTLMVLGAQYWGKNDRKTVSRLFGITLRLSGLTSIAVFLACELIPNYLMMLFTSEQALIEIGSQYLRITGISYLITGFSQCWLALLKISKRTSQAATISISAVIINIVLNGIFIFGLFGLPAMGVKGAALATVLARVVELVWSVLLSFRKDYLKPELKYLFDVNKVLHHDFVHCLLPLLGAGTLWSVGFVSYSSFMGHIDIDAPAANSVASSVIELVCCLGDGLAKGGGIMLGNQLGAGRLETGKLYGERIAKLSLPLGLITMLIMFALTPLILQIVKLNDVAEGYLRGMLIVMSVYTIGRVINTIIINGIFASGGDLYFDLYSLIVCMWGLAVPLAALGTYVFHWPVWLVYSCTCLDEVGKIPWVLYHFKKYKWVRDLTRQGEKEPAEACRAE